MKMLDNLRAGVVPELFEMVYFNIGLDKQNI